MAIVGLDGRTIPENLGSNIVTGLFSGMAGVKPTPADKNTTPNNSAGSTTSIVDSIMPLGIIALVVFVVLKMSGGK